MKTKLSIERSNTDIKKLWCLVHNGVIDRRTMLSILDKSDDDTIVFSSKYMFEKYKALCNSTCALYKN